MGSLTLASGEKICKTSLMIGQCCLHPYDWTSTGQTFVSAQNSGSRWPRLAVSRDISPQNKLFVWSAAPVIARVLKFPAVVEASLSNLHILYSDHPSKRIDEGAVYHRWEANSSL